MSGALLQAAAMAPKTIATLKAQLAAARRKATNAEKAKVDAEKAASRHKRAADTLRAKTRAPAVDKGRTAGGLL